MFESFLAVPLHFTIEFLGFLVAVGGALLAATRTGFIPGPSSNRYSVALGFGALAVAQALHGGSFYPGDGEPEVVAIRALAYALILIGVVGGLRPGVAAIAGFEIREPLLLAPAGAALLVAVAAFSASRRDRSSLWARLAIGMLLISLAELATAEAPDAVFGGGTAERFAYIAHGIKTIGFLAIGSWMWEAVRSSIRVRFVASFASLLVAVVLALSTALTGVISNNVEGGELDRVATQAQAAADQVTGEEIQDLFRSVRFLAGQTRLAEAIEAGSDAGSLARDIEDLGIFDTDFIIVDPAGRRLPGFVGKGPTVRREKAGKTVATPLTKSLRAGLLGTPVVTGLERAQVREAADAVRVSDAIAGREFVAVLAATKVRGEAGEAGVIIFGRWVDYLMMEKISAPLGSRASLVAGEDRVIASNMSRARRVDLRVPEGIVTELRLAGSASAQIGLGGVSFFNGFAPLESSSGVEIATVVISSRANVVADTREGVNRLLFIAAMLVGAIAMALAWVSGRRITQPIQDLTVTAQLVREGDLSAQAPVVGDDEVGQLGETFNEMTASLLKMTDDLRRAAREEHALRSRIETIIQSMADGLVAVDADLSILAFNREAEHLTGVPVSEAMGRQVGEVLSAKDAQGQALELPIATLSEGSLGGIFLESRDRDAIPVAVTTAVLRTEDDEISGAVAVLRDMTREREVERMKTEFLSNISHELRTPLTPIKGYAEILSRKEVPREKLVQFVRGILESTSRLERIVELLVDFASMEAGRMAPRTTHVDLIEILNDLAAQWQARASGHEVVAELPNELPHVLGDERLLRRSLEELLDNAVKFSPQGGTIRIQAREAVDGKGSPELVEITISDEGIGITPEDLPTIFSDFHQLDGSETRTYGGLGLGLAFVRRIAQAHDGDVTVDSAPDEGTRMTISIPASAADRAVEVVGD